MTSVSGAATADPFPETDGHHHHHHHDHEEIELNPAGWTDTKRYAWLLGLFVPFLPFMAWIDVEITGWSILWYIGPFVIFGIFPLLDIIAGVDSENPPDSVLKWLEQDRYYRWCTYLFIPVQYAGLILACWLWGSGELSLFASLGLALTVSMVSGIAINTAHELGHKRDDLERWLSKIALAQSGYGHFFIEHNRGHHVRVATPEDPASSRLGESFWAFLPRTVIGSLRSSWELESKRLDRIGASRFGLKNDVVNAWAMTVVLFAGLAIAFGPIVLPFLVIQMVIGFSLLEVVNYLEHYGLLRGKRDDGRYELTRPEHSWNSNNVASNVLLYHLQRHSDHHANPTRRYQALRHVDDAPQLPSGYAGMILLALFPPVWRRVMDQRLIDHYDGDPTRANIQPRKRERVLAAYGAGGAGAAS
ncbi:MAG TPA: alkane 1-monooxygenase [Solirubrobacterales bacterium]|nr:alkane 1-monooxygenase [Solirubrobacterales bacterium]